MLAWCVLVLRLGSGVELHRPGCDRCCPTRASSSACPEDRDSGVLREQGVCGVCGGAVAAAAGPVGLVWTVYEMASEVVGLLESMLRRLLHCIEFQGCASDSVLRLWGAAVPGQGWLLVQTVQKTVEVPQLRAWSMFAGAVHRRLWTSLCSCRDVFCSSWTRSLTFPLCPTTGVHGGAEGAVPVVVDVPVIKQRQVWVATMLHMAVMAAMKYGGLDWRWRAFSAVLTPFFALFRLSWS